MNTVRRKQNSGGARATPVFIGLAVVYAVLAVVAGLVFSDDTLVQTLLLSLGSSVLGSGIAYFLMRLEQHFNSPTSVVRMFIALAVVFVALVSLALLFFASSMFAYTLLLTTGAGIFAGGLTFFLVKLS